ncbi:hypothetical protein PENSPDRAFT_83654 [Peniophora sp. CONT]|nr:hypothetical protein PENSPDRAFT_83654 [Peniophora sp. CONT]
MRPRVSPAQSYPCHLTAQNCTPPSYTSHAMVHIVLIALGCSLCVQVTNQRGGGLYPARWFLKGYVLCFFVLHTVSSMYLCLCTYEHVRCIHKLIQSHLLHLIFV